MAARKRVLVCGATGFIGRNIAEAFASDPDLEVVGTHFTSAPLSNPAIRMIKADLRNPQDAERVLEGVDILIQAAATTSGAKDIVNRPHIHVTDNAVMNSLLFRSAFEQRVEHVVFFSCSVMYPSSASPLKESAFDPAAGIHPQYFGVGWTKVYIEKLCEFYAGRGKTKFTAIRHANAYGPHDKFDLERSHVCGATIAKVMSAADGDRVTVWGKGEEARDLLYISDLVEFVRLALEKQQTPFGLYNAGSGQAVTVNDLVARIIAASGKNLTVAHDLAMPSIETRLCLDSSKARAELGWEPKVPLDEGIRRTVDWRQARSPV